MGETLSRLFVDVDQLPPNGFGVVQVLFLGCVYMYVLYLSSNLIASGSELLLLFPAAAGLVGTVVLPILGAVPDSAMVLFSGLGPKEVVQEQVSVGIGALAGSTIMLLTIPWAMTIWFGRVSIANGKATYSRPAGVSKKRFTKLQPGDSRSLSRAGIQPDKSLRKYSYVMLITSLSYVVVQIPAFRTPAAPALVLNPTIIARERPFASVGVVMTCVLFIGYLVYCVWSTNQRDMAEERIEGARRQALRNATASFTALFGADLSAEEAESLLDAPPTELSPLQSSQNRARRHSFVGSSAAASSFREARQVSAYRVLRDMFQRYDANGDGVLDRNEATYLFRDLNESPETADHIFAMMDADGDGAVTFHEFTGAVVQFLRQRQERRASLESEKSFKAVEMRSREGTDTDDGEEGSGDEDEPEMPDDLTDLNPTAQKRRVAFRAAWMMLVGCGTVLVFSDPMVSVMDEIGTTRLGIGAFYVSFILAPIASNLSEVIASGTYAARRTQRTATIALQQLLGAAIMNNTLCLGVFLALVRFRGLPWVYTAETLAILLIEILVAGICHCKTMNGWTALLVLCFYPLSLFMVWFLENIVGWN